jgi:putative peptidoglycan lipid II flippase
MAGISERIARNAAVVASATMLSRVLGLVRDLVTAFALGAGPMADAFFVAFRIPNLLRSLFAEGSLAMAFIPVFTRTEQEHGKERAFRVARAVQFWIVAVLGVIVALVLLFPGPVTMAMAFGFKAKDPGILDFTATLLRLCFPYILFISSVALCMGVLNSRGRFLAPAMAPCVLNVVLITAALTAYLSGWNVAVALAVGVPIAGLGQLLLQQPFLRREGFRWSGPWSPRDPEVVRIGRLMLPTVVGSAVYQLNIVAGTLLASFLPFGSITYLYYADRLVQLPLGVFGVAVSTAALPSLAALASSGRLDEYRSALNTSIGLTLFVSIPSAAGLIGLAVPLIDLLFGRGAFTSSDVYATALALTGYAVGLPAFSCARSLVAAFYAREDTRTPVKVACLCLTMNIALGAVLMQFMGHAGLALATSLSSWTNVLLLGHILSRKIGSWFSFGRRIPSVLALSMALLVCCLLTAKSPMLAVGMIPLWVAAYFIGARILGMEEAVMAFEGLRRMRAKLGSVRWTAK